MTEYQVAWFIDIEADTPLQAAQKAKAIQERPGSDATFFEVTQKNTGEMGTIDLEEYWEEPQEEES